MDLVRGAGWCLVFGVWLGIAGCGRGPERLEPEVVWEAVQEEAAVVGLDPGFVYAIVWAESSLRPRAETEAARGLMQLTEGAWKMVTTRPYSRAFHWRTNLRVGVAYLAYNRDVLVRAGVFNYPRLAAAYRYGRNRLAREEYDLSRLPQPSNRIYAELFQGNLWPVVPPGGETEEVGASGSDR